MRILRTLAVAALGAVMSTAAASALEIKLGHVGAPGSLFEQTCQEFATRANAKLGSKAKVVVYGSSQLGSESEMKDKVKAGTLEMSVAAATMSTVAPEFGLFEMPYLVKDRDHAARIREAIINPVLKPAAEKHGWRVLATWENGFRHISNNVRPISKPEDLQGIKLRVPNGEWRVKMFQAYGATPTGMAFNKVYAALKDGSMDGQENPLSQTTAAKFHEVQKFVSMTGHLYSPSFLLVGKAWDSMPEDVRKILQETATEVEPIALALGGKLDDDLLLTLKEAGVKVNNVDKIAFIKASRRIYDEFSQQVPGAKDMIEKAIALGQSS